MNKTTINEIIRKKIGDLEETNQMKAFLLEVLEHEIVNLDQAKTHYTKEYRDLIRIQVNSEGGK